MITFTCNSSSYPLWKCWNAIALKLSRLSHEISITICEQKKLISSFCWRRLFDWLSIAFLPCATFFISRYWKLAKKLLNRLVPRLHIISRIRYIFKNGKIQKTTNYLIGANSSWNIIVIRMSIFVLLNQYWHPDIKPKFFRKRLDGKCILNQSRYSKFYKTSWQHPKPKWGPSVPLQYTVDISTGRPKKLCVWHW